jgi:hypothetical protein
MDWPWYVGCSSSEDAMIAIWVIVPLVIAFLVGRAYVRGGYWRG